MGMYTDFSGEIIINDKRVLKYIEQQIKLGYDDADYPFGFFFDDTKIKGNKLIVDSYERNYENEVETALAGLIKLDPTATGVVLSTYSDGTIEDNPEIRERFTLRDAKIFKAKLKKCELIYNEDKEYKVNFDKEEFQDIINNLNKIEESKVCIICRSKVDIIKFNFIKRGYYNKIKEETGIESLCEKCYKKLKTHIKEKEELKKDYDNKLDSIKSQIQNIKEKVQ